MAWLLVTASNPRGVAEEAAGELCVLRKNREKSGRRRGERTYYGVNACIDFGSRCISVVFVRTMLVVRADYEQRPSRPPHFPGEVRRLAALETYRLFAWVELYATVGGL